MRHRKNLRPKIRALGIDECVGEPVKVVMTQAMIPARPTLLVFNEQIADPFVFCKKRTGNSRTGMLCVVDGSVAEFNLSVRVQPVAHTILARTRSSA